MEELVQLLIKENKTISVMESCTGGGICNAITNVTVFSYNIKTLAQFLQSLLLNFGIVSYFYTILVTH